MEGKIIVLGLRAAVLITTMQRSNGLLYGDEVAMCIRVVLPCVVSILVLTVVRNKTGSFDSSRAQIVAI